MMLAAIGGAVGALLLAVVIVVAYRRRRREQPQRKKAVLGEVVALDESSQPSGKGGADLYSSPVEMKSTGAMPGVVGDSGFVAAANPIYGKRMDSESKSEDDFTSSPADSKHKREFRPQLNRDLDGNSKKNVSKDSAAMEIAVPLTHHIRREFEPQLNRNQDAKPNRWSFKRISIRLSGKRANV
jgi:hypothetical protein